MKEGETDSRQLTLTFDSEDFSEFESCREYVAERMHQQTDKSGRKRLQKSIAMDMDLSPSGLSRKLAQVDSQRFTLDDLEKFIDCTGDTRPILWLFHRYCSKQQKSQREIELERELEAIRSGRAAA